MTPRVELSPQALGQVCYVPRRVSTFQEEALIVPGPATQRWNAGRVLYGVGTGLSMASLMLSSIGGIYVAAGGSTASLSDPAAAISLAGTVGNLTGTALLVSGLAAQHSALGLIGKDDKRYSAAEPGLGVEGVGDRGCQRALIDRQRLDDEFVEPGPELGELQGVVEVRRRVDPDKVFMSDMGRRLELV